MIFNDKRGGVVLRDMIFFILIFSGIVALASIFVLDMGTEYGNTNMVNEYSSSNISSVGTVMFNGLASNVSEMEGATKGDNQDGIIGTFQNTVGGNVIGTLKGVGKVISIVFATPVYIGNAVSVILEIMLIPSVIASVLGNLLSLALYITIIFVIVSAALRGGKL